MEPEETPTETATQSANASDSASSSSMDLDTDPSQSNSNNNNNNNKNNSSNTSSNSSNNSSNNSNSSSSTSTMASEKESSVEQMMRFQVKHTLVVNGTNAICPIEVLLTASDPSGDLIPKSYDPELFFAAKKSKSSKKSHHAAQGSSQQIAQQQMQHLQQQTGMVPLPFQQNVQQMPPPLMPPHMVPTHGMANLNNATLAGNSGMMADADNGEPPRKRRRRSGQKKVSYAEPDDDEGDEAYDITDDFSSYNKSGDAALSTRPTRASARIQKKQQLQEQDPMQMMAPQPSQAQTQMNQAAAGQAQQQEVVASNNVAQQELTFQWVQCDDCMQWRRIPTSVDEKELEGRWVCSMNRWDPDRNTCEAPEEDWNAKEEQTIEVGRAGDSAAYLEEQKRFYEEIDDFYQRDDMLHKNLVISDLDETLVGNKNLDFYQLYLEVTKRDGFDVVTQKNLWGDIFKCLECYSATLSATGIILIKDKYSEFLLDYEREYYAKNGGKEGSLQRKEGSNDSFRKSDVTGGAMANAQNGAF